MAALSVNGFSLDLYKPFSWYSPALEPCSVGGKHLSWGAYTLLAQNPTPKQIGTIATQMRDTRHECFRAFINAHFMTNTSYGSTPYKLSGGKYELNTTDNGWNKPFWDDVRELVDRSCCGNSCNDNYEKAVIVLGHRYQCITHGNYLSGPWCDNDNEYSDFADECPNLADSSKCANPNDIIDIGGSWIASWTTSGTNCKQEWLKCEYVKLVKKFKEEYGIKVFEIFNEAPKSENSIKAHKDLIEAIRVVYPSTNDLKIQINIDIPSGDPDVCTGDFKNAWEKLKDYADYWSLHGFLPTNFSIPSGGGNCPDMKNSTKPELEISTDGQFCFLGGKYLPYKCQHHLAGGLFKEAYEYTPQYHFENDATDHGDIIGPTGWRYFEMKQMNAQCSGSILPDIKAEFQDGTVWVEPNSLITVLWDSTTANTCEVKKKIGSGSEISWITADNGYEEDVQIGNQDVRFKLYCPKVNPTATDEVLVKVSLGCEAHINAEGEHPEYETTVDTPYTINWSSTGGSNCTIRKNGSVWVSNTQNGNKSDSSSIATNITYAINCGCGSSDSVLVIVLPAVNSTADLKADDDPNEPPDPQDFIAVMIPYSGMLYWTSEETTQCYIYKNKSNVAIYSGTQGEGTTGSIGENTIFEIYCSPAGYDCIEIDCLNNDDKGLVCSYNDKNKCD